jgi:hypothetical protein
MNRFLTRVLRSVLLDADVYEEVETDKSTTTQAFAVVTLASLAAGIGSLDNNPASSIGDIAVAALAVWLSWAWLTWGQTDAIAKSFSA